MDKLTRWIDLQNERVCLKINQIYYQKWDVGCSIAYVFNPVFYPHYLLRIFFITLNFLRFNKKLYLPYIWAWQKKEQYPTTLSRTAEIFLTFLGLRFFSCPHNDAYYYHKKINIAELNFNQKSSIRVSIIVYSPTEKQTLQTCLKSIFINTPINISYEVILVDNSPTSEIQEAVKNINGLTYIKSDTSSKNLGSCKKAIEIAKGEYICFLNAQTLVLPLWLESLMETIQEDPEVGCVGPKLLRQCGLIKQAGGVVDEDGNYHDYGNYQHSSSFNYDYKRPIDFCEHTNLLVKKADLNQINGFDSTIENSIYQAIDMCFSIRHHLGKKIIYQPSSTVVDFQVIRQHSLFTKTNENISSFTVKWLDVLAKKYQFINLQSAATKFLPQKTISVIDSYLPFFDKESGSNRLFQLLKIFQKLGYHVNFIPNDGKYVAPYYRILTAKLGIPVVVNFCGKRQFKLSILELINKTEILWISRPNLNLKYQYLLQFFPKIKWIYDTVDLHYVRLLRQATNEKKPSLIKKALRIKKLELALANSANATIAITEVEKDILKKENVNDIFVIPNVHHPKEIEQSISFAQRKGIVFIGGYKHKPNVDAVIWLMKEIMPLVRLKLGDIPVYLLGTYPNAEILGLACKNVFVPGYLEDVNSYFLNARLFVAPLRYGAGMKGKIGQSLEYGLPIVSTTIGAEGMNLIHDHNVLIADDSQSFANEIIRLYQDQEIWERIKSNSLKSIEAYTPKMVGEKLQSLFEKIQQAH